MDSATWAPPPEGVTPLDVAFGSTRLLPPMSGIPAAFKDQNGTDAWGREAARWFNEGPDKTWLARIVAKPGVDRNQALGAVQALLTSFEPKHEHKMAGAAFLLASWFTDPEGAREATR